MTAQNHIHLISTDSVIDKMFRVIAEGYDDGTWNRAESVRRLVGGGVDQSLGATYRTWAPIIMVRHTEPVSGYGTLDDLETFYKYNNPNATKSPIIKFATNHHTDPGPSPTINVIMTGQMQKQCLGCQIEGTNAWYIYRLSLMEV